MITNFNPERAIGLARKTLSIEAEALLSLGKRFDVPDYALAFTQSLTCLLACSGRVILAGVGKSGHIARKLAGTLASTGTPAFFVHPTEASHGDLGMVTRSDTLIALSYSGETSELLMIIPLVKRAGAKLIAMTGKPNSRLAQLADIHLDVSVAAEACPLNLAPTASTTATLAMGDALALALLDARGFSAEDFARFHPGGMLGKKLLTYVSDIMRTGDEVPSVSIDASITQAIFSMTAKRMGMTVVLGHDGCAEGIFTDGDLRRLLERASEIRQAKLRDFMTHSPLSISPKKLAVEAVRMMQERRINQLIVTDTHQRLIGALNMHDLLSAKVV